MNAKMIDGKLRELKLKLDKALCHPQSDVVMSLVTLASDVVMSL